MESNSTAFLIKIKLRHSLGRPSRSDFVQFEFYVVKKMSNNLDIFFYEKLLKLFFNSLRLIIGRPNNMIFYCFTGESFRYLFK